MKITLPNIAEHSLIVDFDLDDDDDLDSSALDNDIYIQFMHNNKQIGSGYFYPMPGCCGMVISTGTYINDSYRGMGLSKIFHQLKEKLAKDLGYTMMISTTIKENKPQLVGAGHAGWKEVAEFNNKRTGNQLAVMVKELK